MLYLRILAFLLLPIGHTLAEPITLVTSSIRYDSQGFGLAKSILAEISRRTPYEFTLTELPSKRAAVEVIKGNFDGDVGRIFEFGQRHPNLIRIDEPIAELPHYAYTYTRLFPVNGWESLKPHRIAVIHGHIFAEKYMKDHKRIRAHNLEHALQLLKNNRADIFVSSPFLVEEFIRNEQEFKHGIQRLEPAINSMKQYTYFNKGNERIAKAYSEALVAMKADGTYQEILNKYAKRLLPQIGKKSIHFSSAGNTAEPK